MKNEEISIFHSQMLMSNSNFFLGGGGGGEGGGLISNFMKTKREARWRIKDINGENENSQGIMGFYFFVHLAAVTKKTLFRFQFLLTKVNLTVNFT